jgi:hypothetical protein
VTAPAQNPPAPQAMAAFADPSAVGGTRPAIRDLIGRVVVIRPTRYEPSAPAIKAGETQERVTADILIVTGGPLEFGGNLVTANKPHTYRVQSPYLAQGVYISNTNIVAAVRDYVGTAPVLGWVALGVTNTPGNNAPYNLLTVEQTEPEYTLAGQLYSQVLNGTFANPTPETIGATPVPAPAQSVAQLQDRVNTAYQVAQNGGPVPAAPTMDPAAAFQAWLAQQQVPAAAASIPPAPSGWIPDVWAGLTDDQRKQFLAGTPF